MSFPDHIVYQTLQDEIIVLDLNAGRYYSLAGSGARIWELLRDGHEIADIVKILVGEFDVGELQLQSDVEEFVQSLVERGLMNPEPRLAV